MDPQDRIVTIVTGANSGIGYAIVRRLIEMHYALGQEFIIIMACRNMKKAFSARKSLAEFLRIQDKSRQLEDGEASPLQILKLDLSSPASVVEACEELTQRFIRIDRIYLNAGTLTMTGLDWKKIIKSLFIKGPTHTVVTGANAMIQKKGEETRDGIGHVFASNVMGHYALVKNIAHLMKRENEYLCKAMVIWMSSGTATSITQFDYDDIEGLRSDIPYEHSKKLCEILAVEMGPKLHKEYNIHTFVMSPGVCLSNIVEYNIFGRMIIVFLIILLKIMGVPGANVFPYYSAYAAVELAMRTTGTLLPQSDVVHSSNSNIFFKSSVIRYVIDPGYSSVNVKYKVLDYLEETFRYRGWMLGSTNEQ